MTNPAAWPKTLAMPDHPGVRSMTVNGARLAYVDRGAGAPIVAVHGALSDLRIWQTLGATLADDNRFVAPTQRYFGPDDWPDPAAHFSRDTHIADLIGFVEALDAGPVDLVTWSYGGEIGLYAMRRRPELFRSAVHYELLIGALLTAIDGGPEARADFPATLAPALAALKAGQVADAGYRSLEAVFSLPPDGAKGEPEAMQALVRDNARTLAPFLQLAPPPALTDADLAAMTAPVLIVHGEGTHARYKLIAGKLMSALPNAVSAVLPAVSHDGPYRDPVAFAGLIRTFLRRLEPA